MAGWLAISLPDWFLNGRVYTSNEESCSVDMTLVVNPYEVSPKTKITVTRNTWKLTCIVVQTSKKINNPWTECLQVAILHWGFESFRKKMATAVWNAKVHFQYHYISTWPVQQLYMLYFLNENNYSDILRLTQHHWMFDLQCNFSPAEGLLPITTQFLFQFQFV